MHDHPDLSRFEPLVREAIRAFRVDTSYALGVIEDGKLITVPCAHEGCTEHRHTPKASYCARHRNAETRRADARRASDPMPKLNRITDPNRPRCATEGCGNYPPRSSAGGYARRCARCMRNNPVRKRRQT